MKRACLFILTIFLLLGCAQLKQAKVDFQDCWNDTACREEALKKSEDVAGKAAAISALSPVPGTAIVVRPLATGIGLLVFLVLGGHALRKKREAVAPPA